MYAFEYRRAASIDDAVAALERAEDGQLLAGGQTLIPTFKQRLAQPSHVIDINGIAELAGISRQGGDIVLGATTCHADVA
ncbi:MAG: FAD binding domain-containing protein, partial [Gammaproteobacteria bacterium]